jgi:hypothetical protein
VQTITDPTNPADWTSSYSVLYSGTHYSVNGVSDGTASGYTVWHTKSDGVYRNNSKKYDNSVFNQYTNPGKALSVGLVWDTETEAGWVSVLHEGVYDHLRVMHFYYSANLDTTSPTFEDFNYEWYRPGVGGVQIDDDNIGVIFQAPLFTNPRSELQGSVLAVAFKNAGGNTPMYPFRGIGAGSGISYMTGGTPMRLADGYYYIFGGEVHVDALRRSPALGVSTNLGRVMPVWVRSKDLKHWSEPVIGPTFKNGHGVRIIEAGDYVYWTSWETVWRRPTTVVEYDLTNYVPEVEFDVPRDNQPGLGRMPVANPDGVNDYLLDLSDKELNVRIGARVADGTYEFVEFDQFFMKQTIAQVKGSENRLQLEFGNIWDRLDNQMKDVTTFVGRFVWDDFSPTTKNEPFNYFFASDTKPTVVGTNHRLQTKGIVLVTAWKGHNPDIQAQFSNMDGNARLIARYINGKNYWYLEHSRSTPQLRLRQIKDGVDTVVHTWNSGDGVTSDASPKLRLRFRWYRYDVWMNGVFIGGGTLGDSSGGEGYCGVASSSGRFDVGYIHVEDYEFDLTMADLIKTALAMGDFHEALVSDAGTRAYAITWGPRTDVATISDALRMSMEAERLQLIWRNGSIVVGKFNDTTSMKTIDNRIIESDEIEEANRRTNFAQVDGNDRFWIEVDTADVERRARLLVSYLDLPELNDLDAITERAREELRRAAMGSSPGGTTPLYFDLNRMDTITWVDNAGNSHLVRIEGFQVQINQSTKPHQHQTFDLAEYIQSSDGSLIIPELEE